MLKKNKIIFLLFLSFSLFCFSNGYSDYEKLDVFLEDISISIPLEIKKNILINKKEFLKDLNNLLRSEKNDLFVLVDKGHLIEKNKKIGTIVSLKNIDKKAYILNNINIQLSDMVLDSLQDMAIAAKQKGVKLVVSSGYRSYNYQYGLFNRYVKKYGLTSAERFSARAGSSQHQLGTTIDFGSIDDAYANTSAGKWLKKHASTYGWSLSYPKNMENVTGYKWECWHYRYLGINACNIQKKWFKNIQQYMLLFIHEWKLYLSNEK